MQFGQNSPGMQILNWEEYSYQSEFLVPCDAFTMRVGDKSVTPQMRQMLQGGQEVQLFMQVLDVNGNVLYTNPIFTGFVDQISIENSRDGTFFNLRGRNFLGPLCDSGIDPWSSTYKFVDGQTLADVMGTVFSTFGITTFYLTDAQNRQITTGVNKAYAHLSSSTYKVTTPANILSANPTTTTTTTTITQWVDPTNTYDLQEKSIKKLQPKHDETFMQFVEFNLARFGLTCWTMSDGSGVVIGAPDYLQDSTFNITNRLDGQGNNIISGRLEIDPFNMPSAIIAKGYQGGGSFQTTRIRTCKVNEFIGYPIMGSSTDQPIIAGLQVNGNYVLQPALQTQISKFTGLKVLPPNVDLITNYAQFFTPPNVPKIVYWEDSKSRTLDQLNAAVMRKMAEFQRHGFRLHYTVQDHTQNGLVWKHNTIVNVYDETLGIVNEPFWILSVNFKKNRTQGTSTELVMIPIGTLILGPQ